MLNYARIDDRVAISTDSGEQLRMASAVVGDDVLNGTILAPYSEALEHALESIRETELKRTETLKGLLMEELKDKAHDLELCRAIRALLNRYGRSEKQ